ncbi:hypothetical protein M2V63_28510, partial [Klebsiella pneumoniae]|nr:hypothetical protein [Klebsiella pneumoniae]MDZ1251966.1 hypothetical protein [Klebsiella pneumoniae]MDZ1279736.1 hypothetical protein [Klebsiella pneumoniae]
QNDVTLKMPAFEWVHVQLHQQKGMISLSPPTICNSAAPTLRIRDPHKDEKMAVIHKALDECSAEHPVFYEDE